MIQQNGKSHVLLLYYVLLEYQSSLFMMAMESNNEVTMKPSHNYNPTTWMQKKVCFLCKFER
jgi:hypothetical protein